MSTEAEPSAVSRPWPKSGLAFLRRTHLYLGLLLYPWAILYGVTAFLFNHPSVFSDSPTTYFGRSASAGTTLETLPTPQRIAENVLEKLNAMQKPTMPYTLAGPAKFGREYAFGTVNADGQVLSFLVDPLTGTGTLRVTPPERREVEQPPFVVSVVPNGARPVPPVSTTVGIKLDNPIHEQIRTAMPTVLERTGFPNGTVTVTSVPDVVFPILADGRIWVASYNPMTGAVSGSVPKPGTELGWRRFFLRLHTAHGYPAETSSRWFWAVIVDVMAFALCYWAVTGMLMWWQLKATRRLGLCLLVVSSLAAVALGFFLRLAMVNSVT